MSAPKYLVDLTPTIVESLEYGSGTLAGAKRICLVLIDGLGQSLLTDFRGHIPFLRKVMGGTAYTVTPSTTAAAITTTLTGKTPVQTGILGYEMRLAEGVTSMINFGKKIDSYARAASYQTEHTIFEILGRGVAATNPKFAGSGLSGAATRGADICGGRSFAQRVDAALSALRGGNDFVYLYSEDVDHCGHQFGAGSAQWLEALENTDHELEHLARSVPTGTTIIITADHGMIEPEQIFDIAHASWAKHVAQVAGEPRALHLFASASNYQERVDVAALASGQRLIEIATAELEQWGTVSNRAQIAAEWGMAIDDIRVPDLLVQARDKKEIVDSRHHSDSAIAMKGVHGSVTAEEMLIPMIILQN